jgi:RNA polymerase sigma factor FliA
VAGFKLKGSADARELLIPHYSPLVKYVAGRVSVGLPPNIEQADLVSYGIFGLIDAIEKYDPGRASSSRPRSPLNGRDWIDWL